MSSWVVELDAWRQRARGPGFHVERDPQRCMVCGRLRKHCEIEVGAWRAIREAQRLEREKVRSYERRRALR